MLPKSLLSSLTSYLWHGLFALECMSWEVVVHAVFEGDVFLLASPRFSPEAPGSWSHLFLSVSSHYPRQYLNLFFDSAEILMAEKACCSHFCSLTVQPVKSYFAWFLWRKCNSRIWGTLKVWSNAVYGQCVQLVSHVSLHKFWIQLTPVWMPVKFPIHKCPKFGKIGNLIRAGFYVLCPWLPFQISCLQNTLW